MIIVFLKNLVSSFAATVVATFCMLYLGVDDTLLIEYATVSFFVVFSALYLVHNRSHCDHPFLCELLKQVKNVAAWSIISMALFGVIVIGMWLSSESPYIPKDYHWRNFSPVVLILSAAAFEETLMRGYIFSLMRRHMPVVISSLLSSIIFSLLHAPFEYGFPQFVSHFSFGMLMCALVVRFKSLLPGVVIHSIFNYCIGSSGLSFEMAKSHIGLVHFEGATRSETFLVYQAIVLWVALVVILYAGKLRFAFQNVRVILK